MRRIITLLAALLVLAASSQAHAYLLTNWTLDTTSIGGSEVVTGIRGIGMAANITLVQNTSGGIATPVVGDTFTVTASSGSSIVFKAGTYNTDTTTETPLLHYGTLSLTAPSPLTGAVTSVTGAGNYTFAYDNPGDGTIKLVYTDASNNQYIIAEFDLDTAKSTGNITSYTSATGLLTGSSTISGTMHVLLAGVLFDSSHNDLAGGTYDIEFAALSGGINYGATVTPTQIVATSASANQNFTISVVPEPSSLLLLGSGVLGVAFLKRRSRKSKAA